VNKGYEIIGAEFKKNLTIQLSPVFFFCPVVPTRTKRTKKFKNKKKKQRRFSWYT
jgi:hypothetical protein